jgi:hypothetical protein
LRDAQFLGHAGAAGQDGGNRRDGERMAPRVNPGGDTGHRLVSLSMFDWLLRILSPLSPDCWRNVMQALNNMIIR